MCFGSGKSAEAYYKEMKPEPVPLPSLQQDAADREELKLKDVRRKGKPRRSLLMGGGNASY